MIYDLTEYYFVRCEQCGATIGYEEEDVLTRYINSYNPLECNTIKEVLKVVKCPRCRNYITVDKTELKKEEKEI